MFESKKTNENKTPSDFVKNYSGAENVPIHTMQDDLDKLEGITSYQKEKDVSSEEMNEVEKISPAPASEVQYSDIYKPSKDASKPYSPFLNVSPPSQEVKGPEKTEKQVISPSQLPEKRGLKWGKILSITAACVAFLAIAAGGYYFWITRQSQVSPPTPPVTETKLPEETAPVIVEPQPQKYSWEKPNYLSFDLEVTTAKEIKEKIIEVASEIKEMGAAKPVEFIITDANNNPVDFSIFSIHAGLKTGTITNYLGNKFSLYIYPDSAGNRTALAIDLDLKNKDIDLEKAKAQMKSQEKTLVDNFSFLLLDNIPAKTIVPAFKDSQKQNYPIRYVNLDANGIGDLSLDYAFAENQLVISTSKNTSWAILDLIYTQATRANKENE